MTKEQTPPRAQIKKAVALKYRPGEDEAPKLAAKGLGRVAEKILAMAREHGIPIKEDPDLVEILARLEIDQEVPPEVYVVVAEVLAFVYRANQSWKERLIAGRQP